MIPSCTIDWVDKKHELVFVWCEKIVEGKDWVLRKMKTWYCSWCEKIRPLIKQYCEECAEKVGWYHNIS